jgi:hypothetical protein
MVTDNDFAAITEKALRRGLAVHPLKPFDKRPLLTAWTEKATRDPGQIAEWARLYPTSNYGVIADNTFCILESDNYSELRGLLGNTPLPPTYIVGARANRPHIYFLQTEASRKAGNMDCPGLFEFKQNNKYVVGEGSIHPTGPAYTCLNDDPIIPIPDWLVATLSKLRSGTGHRVSAPLPAEGHTLGEGEGRHPMLVSQAAKMWDGEITETDFFDRLNDINLQYCDPPKTAGHVLDIVRHFMERRKPMDRGPKILLKGRPALHDPFDFVLAPAPGEDEGCFAAEDIHLIQGASGSGKSTLAYQMLCAQAEGKPFLGRNTFGKTFLVVMRDRGRASLTRTLVRMKVPKLPHLVLTAEQGQMPPAPALEKVYLEHNRPQILLVEGLDMWVKDQSSMDAVSAAVSQIREVAEHYHISIIGILGTPKTKPKERYASPRDRAFGSAAWSRMADTVLDIVEDPKTGEREVSLLLRNARAEVFKMEFQGGVLARVDPNIVIGPEETFIQWVRANPNATGPMVTEAFGWANSKACRMLKKYKGGS